MVPDKVKELSAHTWTFKPKQGLENSHCSTKWEGVGWGGVEVGDSEPLGKAC